MKSPRRSARLTIDISGDVPTQSRCRSQQSRPSPSGKRARHLDRPLRLLATLGPGEASGTQIQQIPHHGGVAGELALEPSGGDEQFRAPGRF
jgi:hypothetical protein